jgi:hypothetical protein
LSHSEGALLAGRELVSTLSSEHPPEHEPLLIVFECLMVPCIFYSRLSSFLIDEVDIFMLELVLHGFVVCLDT